MTFIQSIKAGIQTNGRSRRTEYFVHMIFFVILVRMGVQGILSKDVPTFSKPFFALFGLFWAILAVVESIRRLHDIGHSSRFILVFAIPLLFEMVLGQTLVGVIFACPLLYLHFAPGTQGTNPFGEDPRPPLV
jgi:uncharacterized membrane protein YhaH (DUF805 family)